MLEKCSCWWRVAGVDMSVAACLEDSLAFVGCRPGLAHYLALVHIVVVVVVVVVMQFV